MALALLGCISIFGFISSYARMAWKVANYNALRSEVEALRTRYQRLQKVTNQTNQQMASLEMFANEVSVAYGIKQKLEGPAGIAAEGGCCPRSPIPLQPTVCCAATIAPKTASHAAFTPTCSQHLAGGGPPDGRLRRAHRPVLR